MFLAYGVKYFWPVFKFIYKQLFIPEVKKWKLLNSNVFFNKEMNLVIYTNLTQDAKNMYTYNVNVSISNLLLIGLIQWAWLPSGWEKVNDSSLQDLSLSTFQ